ncbi:MAG: hypothetical protein HOQ24_13695 [Mycobacteriaceae bacterium]|nr:hypothetical protein [Mycobacteriaceae bacterium]
MAPRHDVPEPSDGSQDPRPLRACWLGWIAVDTVDQAGVVEMLGLAPRRALSWRAAAELVDDVAHSSALRFSVVVVTPPISGWTLVIGPWCGLIYEQNVTRVTESCRALSARFGRAQAYFHSEQGDGEAWLLTVHGEVIRRWISTDPGLALGNPAGVERRRLDAFGIEGYPEDLDPDDDPLSDWSAGWGDCDALTIAAESSLDPTAFNSRTTAPGAVLVAHLYPE